MIKTTFEVEVSPNFNGFDTVSYMDDSFIKVYSVWMEQEHIKYLYAHGEIVESEIDSAPRIIGKSYTVSWRLPMEHEIWFILKWGTVPGVQTL